MLCDPYPGGLRTFAIIDSFHIFYFAVYTCSSISFRVSLKKYRDVLGLFFKPKSPKSQENKYFSGFKDSYYISGHYLDSYSTMRHKNVLNGDILPYDS